MEEYSAKAVVVLKPTKRPYKPKVRTGCTTCKIRRVKCDETKPSCIRCTSTGRKCDGYEVPRPLLFEICRDERERRSFEYFRQRTAQEISSYNERSFWNRLVLQASYSHEAVRHALAAIGSLHEGLETTDKDVGAEVFGYAFEQHSKAIASLTKPSRPLTTEEVLMSCILFTWFENAQCNFDAAVTHLQNGVKILGEWRARQQAASGSSNAVIEEDLAYILDSLTFMATAMVAPIVAHAPEKRGATYTSALPSSFANLLEARLYFYQLIHWTCEKLGGHEKFEAGLDVDLQTTVIAKVFIHFEAWAELLEKLEVRTEGNSSINHAFVDSRVVGLGFLHLKIQCTMAMIMMKCLPFASEKAFDSQLGRFETIVAFARDFHSKHVAAVAEGGLGGDDKSLGFDLCIIPPLFLTASRCRDPIIRRSAISLLLDLHRWEGIWASDVAACLSNALMAHEEDGLVKPFTCYDVPDSRRLHLVNSTWFSYSEATHRLELSVYAVLNRFELTRVRSFDTLNPEWLKLQCRRSGKDTITDGFEIIWYNRRGDYSKVEDHAFPHDVLGLFPQLAKSDTRLWQMLDSGAAARYLGRFSSNHIFSAHSRSSSLHGDFVTLSGEFTQYLASEKQFETAVPIARP